MHNYITKPSESGYRLDIIITRNFPIYSRNYIQYLIKERQITVNNIIVTQCSHRVKAYDTIEIKEITCKDTTITPNNMSLDIIYEDNDILVINKPAFVAVHGGIGIKDNTIANAIVARYGNALQRIGNALRPGILHRLDQDTTGLMIICKTDISYQHLKIALENREIQRKYYALVWGSLPNIQGTIDKNIDFHRGKKGFFKVVQNGGKHAITHYRVIQSYNNIASFIECSLETGRTHQIRVHMSYIGNSIIGDQKYGHNTRKIEKYIQDHKTKQIFLQMKRQALHAHFISFLHPITKKIIELNSNIPDDIKKLIYTL